MSVTYKYRLKDLVEIKYGRNQKKVEDQEGTYPIYGTGGLMGYANDFLYDKPSVLIGRKGSIQNVRYIENPFWTVDTLFYTIINNKLIVPKYLYYKLSSIDLMQYNEGTTIPSLRTETLNDLELEIQPIDIQKQIVNLISQLDDKIKLNLQMNETLEDMAMTLYKHWFVDFGPFQDGEFVESELGMIPKGWEVKELKEEVKLEYGKALKVADRTGGNVPVFGSSGIVGYHNNSIVQGPGIIVGRKGNVGTVMWSEGNFYPIDTVFYVEPSNGLSLFYLYFCLKQKNLSTLGSDSAVPGLNRDIALKQKIIVPSNESLFNLDSILTSLFKKMKINQEENSHLSDIRDYLLPKLLSGEIDLSDAKEVEQV